MQGGDWPTGNLLNHAVFQIPNYATVSDGLARLADATGVIQPGQPYTAAASGGNYGALTQTVSNQVGAGTNRQFQLALIPPLKTNPDPMRKVALDQDNLS